MRTVVADGGSAPRRGALLRGRRAHGGGHHHGVRAQHHARVRAARYLRQSELTLFSPAHGCAPRVSPSDAEGRPDDEAAADLSSQQSSLQDRQVARKSQSFSFGDFYCSEFRLLLHGVLASWRELVRSAPTLYFLSQYSFINSCDHCGCRTAPRGRNSAITGLMSTIGVPSIASSSCTTSARPSTRTSVQIVLPRRFGRFFPR